ncbi:hypothetical protein RJT34_13373 [Clitoria ternatea]|uniref:Uncharacterized protein n=1 Tax=Clitoria ternatea TaxID=43366 RepID=A0AAN9JNW3_CLITE
MDMDRVIREEHVSGPPLKPTDIRVTFKDKVRALVEGLSIKPSIGGHDNRATNKIHGFAHVTQRHVPSMEDPSNPYVMMHGHSGEISNPAQTPLHNPHVASRIADMSTFHFGEGIDSAKNLEQNQEASPSWLGDGCGDMNLAKAKPPDREI